MIIGNRFSKVAVLAVLVACLGACSATRTQKTVGEQIDDTVLTAKVKAALVENDTTKARSVDVEVFRGIVQLNGFVDTAAEKSQATVAARSVSGVREVRNNLSVGATSSGRSAGTAVDDTVVTARVKAALVGNDDTKAHQINVETRDGVVQLSGFVDNAAAKAAAEREARKVDGVRSVRNEIDVKR
jgi:hyperosmotically inducible periplasmic protein